MMGAFTPGLQKKSSQVPRKKMDEIANVSETCKIPILEYRESREILRSIKFCILPKLPPPDGQLVLLWRVSVKFAAQTPSWSGMITMFHGKDDHPNACVPTND